MESKEGDTMPRVNTDTVVAGGLIAGLLAAIYAGMNELAMSIASGLVGYMGRSLTEHKERDTP